MYRHEIFHPVSEATEANTSREHHIHETPVVVIHEVSPQTLKHIGQLGANLVIGTIIAVVIAMACWRAAPRIKAAIFRQSKTLTEGGTDAR